MIWLRLNEKLLINIGKKSKKAFAHKLSSEKKNKVLKIIVI